MKTSIKYKMSCCMFALSALSTSANALEQDKALHFTASALIAAASYQVSPDPVFVIGTTMAIGIAKEFYDRQRGGKFDGRDIAADLLGALVGYQISDRIFITPSSVTFSARF